MKENVWNTRRITPPQARLLFSQKLGSTRASVNMLAARRVEGLGKDQSRKFLGKAEIFSVNLLVPFAHLSLARGINTTVSRGRRLDFGTVHPQVMKNM